MLLFPNAKINLGLNITTKREDGFHDIESVFLPIPLYDAVEIKENKDLQLTLSGLEIPGNIEDNLIFKAAKLFKNHNYHIHLHKHIPFGGGLGGGSADASFVLKAINNLQSNIFNDYQLEQMALKLGSDCPFFIDNKPKYVTGRGEIFEDIKINLKNFGLVILIPKFGISTKEAYSSIKPEKPRENLKEIIETKPIEEWKLLVKNDFETHLFKTYPILNKIKNTLYETGASYASMSGSGSTMFGIYSKEKLKNINNRLEIYGKVIILKNIIL